MSGFAISVVRLLDERRRRRYPFPSAGRPPPMCFIARVRFGSYFSNGIRRGGTLWTEDLSDTRQALNLHYRATYVVVEYTLRYDNIRSLVWYKFFAVDRFLVARDLFFFFPTEFSARISLNTTAEKPLFGYHHRIYCDVVERSRTKRFGPRRVLSNSLCLPPSAVVGTVYGGLPQ